MKRLNLFTKMMIDEFLEGKVLMAMKSEEAVDFNTKEVIGAKYTILIWKDECPYYDRDDISNAGETFSVKVKGAKPKKIIQPILVELLEPSGVIFGDFRNQLSVTAKDVVPVKIESK
ncbi:hypothetical protein [Sporosarcina sp. FSL K6-3508]|uniref:hypothetical protein n=1 Tax=Sporosarcina sp. FSL K6-3508 TaxID=2921557 RepID=UPI003159F268